MALIRSPLVRRMLGVVLAEPVFLSAEERYLHGHYLAATYGWEVAARVAACSCAGRWNRATPTAADCFWV